MGQTEEDITKSLVTETGIILSGKTEKIDPDAPLAALGFDSMSFIELLIFIEKKFEIKLLELGLQPEDMKTLSALARRIHLAL